jgi:hypothetical protein
LNTQQQANEKLVQSIEHMKLELEKSQMVQGKNISA